MQDSHPLLSIGIALGVGLLVGAERERRKGAGPARSAAGIRTFAVTALSGATAMVLGGVTVMAAVAVVIGGFALLSYRRSKSGDPGMTTEIALLLTCLIGGLCVRKVAPSAGVWPVLLALSANTLVKAVVAAASGGMRFALRMAPGLLAMIAAAWLGAQP